MKKLHLAISILWLSAASLPAGDTVYRLEYQIRGSAISRLLLVFPIRVYYEATAAVDLLARQKPGGGTKFTYAGIPSPAYVLRTLGFSGKTLALLTADCRDDKGQSFAADLLSQWQKQAPEFSERVKTVKKFPHRLEAGGPELFTFERDETGFYRDCAVKLQPRYRYHPAKTGIYFNVFPILAELLKLLNHRFAPGLAGASSGQFPAAWTGEELDFSPDLNRAAGLLEKVVKSMVTVQQKSSFRLHFRVSASAAEEIEICGEAFPDVPLWKGFMIREVFRRLRLRTADRALLADELWLGIRNSKGQGGFGCLQLRLVESGEGKK
jgi:hypothetical protein